MEQGFLKDLELILGNDLNLTVSAREVWGLSAKTNPFAQFFVHLFESLNLVDLEPFPLAPTWRNECASETGVSKCLNRFLIANSLPESYEKYRT